MSDYIATAHETAPYFTLLSHSAGSVSFSSNYSLPSTGRGTSFSPDGNYIAIGHSTAPNFTLLSHSEGSVSFSSNYTLSGIGYATSFSPEPPLVPSLSVSQENTKIRLIWTYG